MKARREHRVPLSKPAVALLRELPSYRNRRFHLPEHETKSSLSNMVMLKLVEHMGRAGLTVHGFRSTFCDWVAERTNLPHEAAEHTLAHSILDKTEAAYCRGNLFDKRRSLMETWARHRSQLEPPGRVVPIRSPAKRR